MNFDFILGSVSKECVKKFSQRKPVQKFKNMDGSNKFGLPTS